MSGLWNLLIEGQPWSGLLLAIGVALPLRSMWTCWRLARKYRRPVAVVALVPVSVWVIPALSFWLREALAMKALPLLGIGLGCAGWVAAFSLSGGLVEQREIRDDAVAKRRQSGGP